MADVNWQDPPPTATRPGRRAGGKYGEIAAALRENPGKTALIDGLPSREAARNFAGQIERGRRKGFEPAGAFEARTDNTNVYVTYVADDAAVDED